MISLYCSVGEIARSINIAHVAWKIWKRSVLSDEFYRESIFASMSSSKGCCLFSQDILCRIFLSKTYTCYIYIYERTVSNIIPSDHNHQKFIVCPMQYGKGEFWCRMENQIPFRHLGKTSVLFKGKETKHK